MWSTQHFQLDGTVQLFGAKGQIFPAQRDNGTSSKSCLGTGWAGTVSENLGQDTGRDNHYFSVKIQDGTGTGWDNYYSFVINSCFRTFFPILERPFLFCNVLFLFQNVLFLFLVTFGKVILSRDLPGQRSLSRDICSCPCPWTKGHWDKKFSLSTPIYSYF